MGLITQLPPTSDTVDAALSGTYGNQLLSSGGTGVLTWSTTNPSPSLNVSSTGQVSTPGTLTIGTYFVGGTVSDTHGNSGPFGFTLTTVGALSPGTGVTPTQSVLPTGVEILVPFQIDPATGSVAVISDYGAILAQHIETIVLTSIGERVMNPTYGYGLEGQVFHPINANTPNMLQSDITKAINKWEPRVKVQTVAVAENPTSPSLLSVTIEFSVIPFSDVNTLVVASGGTIAQVNP